MNYSNQNSYVTTENLPFDNSTSPHQLRRSIASRSAAKHQSAIEAPPSFLDKTAASLALQTAHTADVKSPLTTSQGLAKKLQAAKLAHQAQMQGRYAFSNDQTGP